VSLAPAELRPGKAQDVVIESQSGLIGLESFVRKEKGIAHSELP
jgi:hypothetical protein